MFLYSSDIFSQKEVTNFQSMNRLQMISKCEGRLLILNKLSMTIQCIPAKIASHFGMRSVIWRLFSLKKNYDEKPANSINIFLHV